MFLITALWNPWTQYQNTRHNAGWIVLDMILDKLKLSPERTYEKKFHWYIRKTKLSLSLFGKKLADEPKEIVFLKPETYMNLSGDSVQPLMNFYKVDPKELLVICDDLDQPFWSFKYKPKGASWGQNGIKSIIAKLNTQDFFRLKVGIGRPENPKHSIPDWVLSKFTEVEWIILHNLSDQFIHQIGLFLQGKI